MVSPVESLEILCGILPCSVGELLAYDTCTCGIHLWVTYFNSIVKVVAES